MKKILILILLNLIVTPVITQETKDTDSACKTTDLVLEKLYCTYCENEGESNVSTKVTKSKYAYFDFEGKKAIDIILLLDGEENKPNYIVHIIIPEESLSSGNLETEIIDEWGNGLDNNKSVIVKFQYRVGKSSSISQWSNWGGHNKGESEGNLKLSMQEDGSICGSLSCIVYEDGSSLKPEKHSIISIKSFSATL